MVNIPQSVRVLVVDDELLIRWALREALEARGYLVSEAANAAAARREMADLANTPQAVVLDYRLPDSDNLGLLSAIRRDAPATAVIMMTAHGSAEMVDEALDLGAYRVVSKPFEVEQMVDLVGAAINAN